MEYTYLTVREVADTLRINVLTVYEYIRRRDLDAVKIGRYYRINVTDFQKFVDQHKMSNLNNDLSPINLKEIK